ncbi:unnamed protein product [Darwinula stevensoni]|uniref:Uncharacterized protein n=1 Tax=Darwinula stevensoni TaxID=69355 RepID=A0A7R9AIT4_9CRUS|nr:unnamed protein product [Darwinula stevensoni]CAG0907000.1 unnamed protein product [Darwinula stevensoni]
MGDCATPALVTRPNEHDPVSPLFSKEGIASGEPPYGFEEEGLGSQGLSDVRKQRHLSFVEPDKEDLPSTRRKPPRRIPPLTFPPSRKAFQPELDSSGYMRVRIRKTRPTLGMAIEGGKHTKQEIPRIITLHVSRPLHPPPPRTSSTPLTRPSSEQEDGAAIETPGIRIGQTIVEVDGHTTKGPVPFVAFPFLPGSRSVGALASSGCDS